MDFAERRETALSILSHGTGLSRQAGSFLGQCCVDENPLTEKQAAWFAKLVERFEKESADA